MIARPVNEDEMVQEYRAGASIAEVARKFRRGYGSVRKILEARLSEVGLCLRCKRDQRLVEEQQKDAKAHPVTGGEGVELDPSVASAVEEIQRDWTEEERARRSVYKSEVFTVPFVKNLGAVGGRVMRSPGPR